MLTKEKGVDISGVIPDNTSTWIYSILSYLIPLVLILPLFMGIDGVLYAGPVADGIAFVVSVLLIMREMKKMKPGV